MNDSSNLFSIRNHVAVVTGASSGIGLAISQTLARAGGKVVLVARRSNVLQIEVQHIREQGGVADYVVADLLDRSQLESTHQKIFEKFGNPNIVINAAGINLRESVDDVSWESWDQTVNLNLAIPFFFSRLFVDHMFSEGWGRIINVASLQSIRAFPNGSAYGASKGGIAQLTRAMAEAWSSKGITCNAIAPGFFKTSLTAPVFDNSEIAARMASSTAIGRNGEMDDLEGPIIFLASPASDYVTGQLLFVDGGFTAK